MSVRPYHSALTTGEPYTGGIQEYKGLGNQRWCPLCGVHKPAISGGSIQFVGGLRTWVCKIHPKVKP